ncbi:arylsulfotransferase protein [Purpureocillium lavendulum]|uniref:Arylsulfotransferase protein n=1 Tax=Purpureocillium lavendulum TaxID=1247861 RepID=A0AB34G186_9HYPO|nr:arylsulfotransferase protein [Purpureocillium lavendulum]
MRPSCIFSCAAITIFQSWTALLLHATLASAEQPVFTDSDDFDNATFGKYPVQTFKSTGIVAPRPNFLLQDSRCEGDLYTFLTPRGYVDAARNPQMTILDQRGHLVWTSKWEGKQIYNLMVQRYRGHNYLTFWAGNDAVGGHGAGTFYMALTKVQLDDTYSHRHTIKAGNGLEGDLHEFRLTDNGTALMTVYEVREHDLSSLGKKKGPIWDCLIQEAEVETGKVVFQWRASEHFNVSDTFRAIGGEGDPGGAPFDWFHINSIDKDPKGNYLISSRYLNCLGYIDGRTGELLWILGGKSNMFKDLSGGKATDFRYQHDARWDNDYTEITLFDNSDIGKLSDASRPRGMRILLDQELKTARLVADYRNPRHIPAESQGSTQTLPGGNVIVGFGFTAAWTEFAHDGTPLCDVHYGAQSRFGTGDVQSYRVLKFAWRGLPTTDPDLAVVRDDAGVWRAYTSWNGATEVAEWVLQGATAEDGNTTTNWRALETVPKDGFETDFVLAADHPKYLRAVAMDGKGNALGTSKVLDASEAVVDYNVDKARLAEDPSYIRETVALSAGVMAGVALAGMCVMARPAWAAWRRHGLRRKAARYRKLSTGEVGAWSEAM